MDLAPRATARVGGSDVCSVCHAGNLISFSWPPEPFSSGATSLPDKGAFVSPEALRRGTLYRCAVCGRPWYLNDAKRMMNHVVDERLSLIRRWNEQPITLRDEMSAELDRIGCTPPDQYGNGHEYREFPCGVVTTVGERIDIAIVSFQRDAPFEHWRNCRLGSDIGSIHPSPFALPLSVRIASSRAEEMRMGFAPTLVEGPAGQLFILNWRADFLVSEACKADEIKLSKRRFDWSNMPRIVGGRTDAIYFVVDDG